MCCLVFYLFSAAEFGVCVLSPDTLVEEALNAHIIGEQVGHIHLKQ